MSWPGTEKVTNSTSILLMDDAAQGSDWLIKAILNGEDIAAALMRDSLWSENAAQIDHEAFFVYGRDFYVNGLPEAAIVAAVDPSRLQEIISAEVGEEVIITDFKTTTDAKWAVWWQLDEWGMRADETLSNYPKGGSVRNQRLSGSSWSAPGNAVLNVSYTDHNLNVPEDKVDNHFYQNLVPTHGAYVPEYNCHYVKYMRESTGQVWYWQYQLGCNVYPELETGGDSEGSEGPPTGGHVGVPISDPDLQGRNDILFFMDFESESITNNWLGSSKPYWSWSQQYSQSGSGSVRAHMPNNMREPHDVKSDWNSEHDEAYMRWYRFYPNGFDFRRTHKGPGMYARDKSYPQTACRVPNGYDLYSCRVSSGLGGILTLYTYNLDQPEACGEGLNLNRGSEGRDFRLSTNFWHMFELRIKANSVSGTSANPDGELELWIDGVQRALYTDMRFRRTESLKLNQMNISSYQGRRGEQDADRYGWVDSIVCATGRIGGGGSIPPPTNPNPPPTQIIGQYYPVIPLIQNQKEWFSEEEAGTPLQDDCIAMFDMLGMDYLDFGPKLYEDPTGENEVQSKEDLDYVYLHFGVNINDQSQIGIKYLHDYFTFLHQTAGIANRTEHLQWRYQYADFPQDGPSPPPPPYEDVYISEASLGFVMNLSMYFIDVRVEQGEKCPLGEYVSEYYDDADYDGTAEGALRRMSMGTYVVPGHILRFIHQTSADRYTVVEICNPHFTQHVENQQNHSTYADTLTAADPSPFWVPWYRPIIETYTEEEIEALTPLSLRLTINVVEEIAIPWYNTFVFKVIMAVVVAVVNAYVPGVGFVIGGLFNFAVSVAISFTLGFLTSTFVNVGVSTIIDLWNIDGVMLTLVVAAAATVAVASGKFDTALGLTNPATAWPLVDDFIAVTNIVSNVAGPSLQAETENYLEEAAELKEEAAVIEDEFYEEFGVPLHGSPRQRKPHLIESSDAMLSRALIANPGEASMNMVSDYTDMALKLPTTKLLLE